MKEFRIADYQELIDLTDYDMTAKQAILAKCYECCAFDAGEVKRCENAKCALYKYKEKWWKKPVRFSDETRQRMAERAKNNESFLAAREKLLRES